VKIRGEGSIWVLEFTFPTALDKQAHSNMSYFIKYSFWLMETFQDIENAGAA